MTNPGDWLRELREELHLTRVGVERLTTESASRAANERYRIRRGRLADIEDGHSPPDIFEVASLSECYKVPYPSVLHAFGVQPGEARNILPLPSESRTPQEPWSFTDADRPFSLKFQTSIGFDTTRLVTESPEELGIPAAVRRELDGADFRFGIVGINDDTMGELVRQARSSSSTNPAMPLKLGNGGIFGSGPSILYGTRMASAARGVSFHAKPCSSCLIRPLISP